MDRIIRKVKYSSPKKIGLTKVAAYVRVSNGKDAMLHSLSAQVSYYSKFIQGHKGWLYSGVYVDEAITGTKDNRENFQRMIDDCRNGKIDLILTKSISRFARNTVTLLETVRELKTYDIGVYFEEQNIHTLSADGELMLTILASYAQEESRSASENQKWRIRKAFEQGEIVNLRFLYGYDVTKNGITPSKETAPVVKEIFNRVVNGESFTAIANDLNKRGIPHTNGCKWTFSRITDTITNEKYIGDALLQKKFRNNHLQKKLIRNNGELPKYYTEGTHEGIINRETFQKAHLIAEERKKKYWSGTPQHRTVFSGLIECGNCGCKYKRVTSNGTVGYNCTTYLTKGKSKCAAKKIPEEILKQATIEALDLETFDEKLVRETIEKIIVPENNKLIFILKNGTTIEKEWKDHSRRASWTKEMKEQARQKTLDRNRRNNQCQEQ